MDWESRKKALAGNLHDSSGNSLEPDSHSSIAVFHGFKNGDKLNKWEYSPLTRTLVADQINVKNDKKKVAKLCKTLDFSLIVPQLVIKPIIHPFKDRNRKRVTKKDIELLRLRDSVGDSVRDSVWDSVGDSVWASVWASVGDSVGDSVRDNLREIGRAHV